MMLHRHFEGDAPKTVTKLDDVTPKAPASKEKPEAKATQAAKRSGKAKKN